MRRSKLLCLGVALVLLVGTIAHAQSDELLVYQVQAAQLPLTARVDVWYKLHTVGGESVMITLYLSTDGGATYPHRCESVTGDVGPGVLPGTDRHIVWDAGVDFPGFSSTTCRLRVTADDGANLDDFVYIAPGTFTMGSPTDEPGHWDETQHQVTLTHGIYVQTTEVTNQQFRDLAQWAYDHGHATVNGSSLLDGLDGSTQILKTLGSGGYEISFSNDVFSCINPDHPVKWVTWYGSVAYCDWLSLQQGLPRAYDHGTWQCNGGNPYTAAGYRLPTEAEWEYACRAGTQTAFNTGSCVDAGMEANYDGRSPYPGCPFGPYVAWTVPVGSYPANGYGLYEMHGNILEWCNDWFGDYGGAVTDPAGPAAGQHRVVRAGSWHSAAQECRSACRNAYDPSLVASGIGFRPARSALEQQTGMVTIDPEPNSINAPWQIMGPNGFSQSGNGDTTLADMPVGSYTLTWGAVTGWTTPDPAVVTQILVASGTITFAGVYVEDTGVPVGFVSIPAGSFTMGSPEDEWGHDSTGDETQHQVTLTHGIYVQTTEVTNQQYMELAQWAYDHGHATVDGPYLSDNLDGSTEYLALLDFGCDEITFSDGVFSCINPSHAVKCVNWYGSVAYCDWLSLQQGLPRAYSHSTWQCNGGNPYTAAGYRLPTEAEWEYACRAGTQTAFNTGSCLDAETEANYNGNYPQYGCPGGPYAGWTVPVGSYPANGYGLLDMHGNLGERCNDWWGNYGGTVTDPAGPGAGSSRVARGGGWGYSAPWCRSASRIDAHPGIWYSDVGFRPVRSSD